MFFEWMLFLSVATFLVVLGISGLADRAQAYGAWVVNTVGGVTACCLRKDFVRSTMRARGRVIVPETITFSSKQPPIKGCWLSDEKPERAGIFQWNSREDPSLFVPFLSERDISFETQKRFFFGELQKIRFERMCRNERRRQVLIAMDKNDALTITVMVSAAVAIVCICIIGLQWLAERQEARLKSPASFFATTEAGVVEHRDALSAINRLPVGDEIFGDEKDLERGKVTEVLPIGGGMSGICFERPDQVRVCGISADALGMHPGDTAYFRHGALRRRLVPPGRAAMEAPLTWVISEKEAQALAEHGHSFVK